MTEEQVKKIVKESVPTAADIAAEIRKGNEVEAEKARVAKEASDKAAKEAEAAKGEQAPIFKGDPMKVEDIEAHEKALKVYDLKKGVNWSDPKSVADYKTKIAELNKGDDAEDDNDAGASNQGTHDRGEKKVAKSDNSQTVGLSKEDAELMNAGRKTGKAVNGDEAK